MKKITFLIVFSVLSLMILSAQLRATIVQRVEGVSATGDSVVFESQMAISGDILTVQLSNLSATASNSPDDLLSSYFFDIYNSIGQRPELLLRSATGDVYKTNKSSADTLQTSDADLKAVKKNDDTWYFSAFNSAANPYLGFGVGTVGNSKMTNNFPGNIVGGMDYSLYSGDVTSQSLSDRLLVLNSIMFTFSGVTGFKESDVLHSAAFGLGTSPDSTLMFIPEPSTLIVLAVGSLVFKIKRK
jgi:hypothetical protein